MQNRTLALLPKLNFFIVMMLLVFAVNAQSGELRLTHLGASGSVSVKKKLSNNDRLKIIIQKTAPAYFSYEIKGILKQTDKSSVLKSTPVSVDLSDHSLKEIIHDKRYGGYTVKISRKDSNQTVLDKASKKPLNDVEYIVFVETVGWKVDISGAFVGSTLTDPVFAEKGGVIIRDKGAEDKSHLSIAAMAHLYHQKCNWLAFSFGLGVGDSNSTTYYLGLSYRMSDQAAITAGAAYGSISRLPAGTSIGDAVVAGDNTLNNLGTRTDSGYFLSLSYSFLPDQTGALSKPFQGSDKE